MSLFKNSLLVAPCRASSSSHCVSDTLGICFSNSLLQTFKKKDASLSGDDKGLEKASLEWLNSHLSARSIVVEDLYTCLGDGLNLIYALEDATGESVGKYNKRTMLPVHRIDNISVALNFLSKRGVDVSFMGPQGSLSFFTYA